MAKWSASFVNDLPDSSFAWIEPGGEKDADGKTTPRSKRHLPYNDADGNVDVAHLRNALSRLPQTDISTEAKAAARKKLHAAAKDAGVQVMAEGASTLEQKQAAIRAAIEATLGPAWSDGESHWCIVATYEDAAIVDQGGKLSRFPVAFDLFGVAQVGTSEPVEQVYQALKEARHAGIIGLLEAKDAKGAREWACVVIEEGASANRRFYPASTLQAAVKLFEGVQVYFTHTASAKPEPDPRDLAGFIRAPKVAFIEAAKKTAILATFRSTSARATELLTEAFEANHPGLVGLSINAAGKGQAVKMAEGLFYRVDSIDEVDSVDMVSKPAAGGRFLRLVAGRSPVPVSEEDLVMLEKKLARLKEARPDLYAKLGATPTESEVDALLLEAVEPAQKTAAAAPPPAAKVDPPPSPTLTADELATLRESVVTGKVARATAGRAFGPLKESAERVLRALAERGAEQAAIDAEAERLAKDGAKLTEGAPGGTGEGHIAEVQHAEADKLVSALDGFFAQEDVGKVPRFRSIREAYVAITGDQRITGLLKEAKGLGRFERITEGVTSASWANVLAATLNRSLTREYAAQGGAYSDTGRGWLYTVVPIDNFKAQERVRFGGYGNLSTVAEANPYPALSSPTDEKATYSPAKRGGVESITYEMIRNDDVGAVRRIPQRMALAARRTLYEFAHNLYALNPTIYDSTALFVAGHGSNLTTSALAAATYTAARLVMIKQAEKDSSKRLGLVLRHLMIPPDLEEVAVNLFRRTTENDPKFIIDPAAPMIHVITHLTDATDWFACAGVDQTDQIEIGFLDGREEPELFVADMPTGGSLFTADKIDYKIRHVYGGAVVDFRGFYGGYGVA